MRYIVYGTIEETEAWASANGVPMSDVIRPRSSRDRGWRISPYWPQVFMDSHFTNPDRVPMEQAVRRAMSLGPLDYVVDRRVRDGG